MSAKAVSTKFQQNLKELTLNPEEFPEKISNLIGRFKLDLLSVCDTQDAIDYEKRICSASLLKNVKSTSSSFCFSFIKENYGKNGYFSDQEIDCNKIPLNENIAVALYATIKTGEIKLKNESKVHEKIVLGLFPSSGPDLEAAKLMQSCAVNIFSEHGVFLIGDMFTELKDIHKYIDNPYYSRMLSEGGGVERLVEIGADIEKVLTSLIYSNDYEINEEFSGLIVGFLGDCNRYLLSKSIIDNDKSIDYSKRILYLIVSSLLFNKTSDNLKWSQIVSEYAKFIDDTFSLNEYFLIAQYLDISKLISESIKSRITSKISLNIMERLFDPSSHLMIVKNMGIESIFTKKEILMMNGRKFESDLGL